jgi:predicted DNA-binding protein
MSSGRLSIRLPLQLQRELDSLAKTTGESESELVRKAIEAYVRQHGRIESCYDLAKRTGFLGCVSTGIGDLSTNPKHMEGFGRE